MTSFTVIGHTATTDPSFSLNDLAGGGGRMDLLCRVIGASLFLSHGIRMDNTCDLLLLGKPNPGRIVRIEGSAVRSLSPDERNIAAAIKKALGIPVGKTFRQVSPGVSARMGTLAEHLEEKQYAVLDESGGDIRKVDIKDIPDAFLLSDNQNFSPEEEELIKDLPKFSLGPEIVHADHAIVLILNEIDRRRSGWN